MNPSSTDMADVRAGTVPYGVVSARTSFGIVRAMGFCFGGDWRSRYRKAAERHVGTLDPDIEWTSHCYEGHPAYVHYGYCEGGTDFREVALPRGVYLFRWADDRRDVTLREGERLGDLDA